MNESPYIELFQKIKKPFFIIIILIFMVWLFITLFTSGIVITDGGDSKNLNIILTKTTNQGAVETRSISPGFSIVPAGIYTVTIKNTATNTYTKQSITVQNLLRKTAITTTQQAQSLAVVQGPIKNQNFALLDHQTISYNTNGSIITNDTSPQFEPYFDTCLSMCMNLYPYDETSAIGYATDDSNSAQLGIVSYNQRIINKLPGKSYYKHIATNGFFVNSNDGSFALYDDNINSVYLYTSLESNVVEIKLKDKPASGDTAPLISVTKNGIIVVSGNNFQTATTGDGKSESSIRSDYTINTYTQDGQVTSKILKNHPYIKTVAASPNLKHISVSTAGGLTIFDDNMNTTLSEAVADISQMIWRDDSTVIYANVFDGIYEATLNNTAYAVFANSKINISSFYLTNNRIYTSVFFKDTQSAPLTAITIDLSKQEINNQLLQTGLLKDTNDYTIQFDGQTFIVMRKYNFTTNRYSTGSLQPAYNYIKSVAKDPTIKTIEK